jgi:hypothetical protein
MGRDRNIVFVLGLIAAAGSVQLRTSNVLTAEPTESHSVQQKSDAKASRTDVPRETRLLCGWNVHISRELLDREPELTAQALKMLTSQLEQIIRVVPKQSLVELQKVPLYFSMEYPGVVPKAEYHPGEEWLRENGRDPKMVKAVEFTNVRIFEAEAIRMPNVTLHELSHAYHDRSLPMGFENQQVQIAYARAKDGGKYERVERHNGKDRPNTFERAYAMTNPMEYFAECSETYFVGNDFFPFTPDELKQHDPEMFELLGKLWFVDERKPNN